MQWDMLPAPAGVGARASSRLGGGGALLSMEGHLRYLRAGTGPCKEQESDPSSQHHPNVSVSL